MTPRDLQTLFEQAARSLMFGLRSTRDRGSLAAPRPAQQLAVRPKTATSSDGSRMAILNDRTIGLYDILGSRLSQVAMLHLNNLREIQGWPGLKSSGSPQYQLALSSNGQLLAVALDRTVQIHDLTTQGRCNVVARYVVDTNDYRIIGLDFEQADHCLRIQLSGDGCVLYLGSPAANSNIKATMSHWRSNCGLQHTFLDSSRLTLTSDKGAKIRLSSLQLLQSLCDGYLFAAQKHCIAESSRYVLGHVKCSNNLQTSAQTADCANVTDLASLESFLSSQEFDLGEVSAFGMGRWETMPSAHELCPRFAICEDLLVVAERDKRYILSAPRCSQLFLYRLPNKIDMLKQLVRSRISSVKINMNDNTPVRSRYNIARLPLCLDTVPGQVTGVNFSRVEASKVLTFKLNVVTEETIRMWYLVDS